MSEYSFQPPSLHDLAALLPAYEMMDFLAQGGMGAVYLARQISLDRLVAIKVLPPSWGTEKGYAQRFQTEARAMAKLRHNHIVGVYDFGITTDGHLYLVMEYVEGQTLHDMIRLRRLPTAKVQDIAVQLCDAIQYAHEHGILHRDLKPGNVMVDKHGQVKVMDFGLARRAEAAIEEESLGTPEYTAPEILVTGALIDHRADIYALGIVFQQMLTGVVPRQPREPLAEHGVFDPAWEPLISKAAATNAGARFQTMRELKEAVAHVGKPSAAARSIPGVKRVAGPSPGHGPHSPAYHPTPAPKASTPITPMVVILVLIGAGIFWWLKNRDGLGAGEGASKGGQSTASASSTSNGSNAGPSGTSSANVPSAGDSASTGAGGGAAAPATAPAEAYQLPKDIPTGHVYKFQDGHKDIVNDVVLFPDLHRVATASTDGTIGIWDLHKAKRLQTLGPVPGAVLKIAVSPDGKYLAAGGDNYKVLFWKLEDLQSEPTKSLDLKVRTVTNLEFSKDGATVLAGTSDGQQPLVAWAWETGAEEVIPGFRGQVLGLQMLPGTQGSFVAGGTRRENERWVYDVWSGDLPRRSLVKEFPKPPQGAYRLRIAPDGKTILSLGGGRFQVWDLDAGTRISRQQGGPLSFYRCEFLDGGRLVVGGGQDRALHIFESVTGTEVWKSDPYETRCANAFAVSPDGSFLVSAGGFGFGNPMEKDGDYALHVWKLPDLSTLKTEGAAGAVARRDVLGLETADPELWNLLGTLHQEWQQAMAAKEDDSNRKELDEKYLGALRREVAAATPTEKEHFLSEISRVANDGPVPSQRPAAWPVSLTRLHDIYVQQLGLLPQQSKEKKTELIAGMKNKLVAFEQQRTRDNNAAGAERVRIVMETMRTLGGEPDRDKILQALRNSAASTSSSNSNTGNTSAGGTTSSQPTIQPAGMSAPPMTGPSVLRRPVRTGRVAVWKRSSRTDENVNMQWADTAPQIADAVSVSAAMNHALVLRADGTVAALGKKNSTTQATVPTGLDRVVAVAAGNRYDIALREDGSTVVWSTGGVYPLEGVRPAVAVHAGPSWGYARHADGSLTRLPTGNIGNATAYSEPPPGLGAVVDIAVGTDACIALLPDGSLASWGSSNRAGGMATIPEGKGSGIIAITCNNWDAAVLRRDGEMAVWGAYPNSPPSYSPKRFPGADRVVRALPSGAFAVHFPGDRWMICNSAGGEIIDASTAEPLASGCFDLGVTSLYCVGIKP